MLPSILFLFMVHKSKYVCLGKNKSDDFLIQYDNTLATVDYITISGY